MDNKKLQPKNFNLKPSVKPSLAWTLADFLAADEEAPECVLGGKTEGQVMGNEEALTWVSDSIRILRVMAEEFPETYPLQKAIYEADLDYLIGLGKISAEDKEEALKPENYIFEEPK